MSLFKKAFARGSCAALQEAGVTKFANAELAASAADQIGAEMPGEEPFGDVAPDTTAEVATSLIDLSNALQEAGGQAAETAEAVAKSAADKVSAVQKLRAKISDETGSTITGDRPEQANVLATTPNAEAIVEKERRPENYALGEQGDQEASGEGAVGAEKEVGGTGPAVDGDNSAIEAISKGASLHEIIKKLAQMGSTITGTDPSQKNKLPQAVTEEAKLELKNRPTDYAHSGVGKSELAQPAREGAIGKETPHPDQPKHEGASTNSPIAQTKTADDNAYIEMFQAVADKYAQHLPKNLPEGEKVAAIKYLTSLDPDSREKVGAVIIKTSGELPEALKAHIEGKKDEGEKKEEPKKEEKKEEKKDEKKEAGDYIAKLRGLTLIQ